MPGAPRNVLATPLQVTVPNPNIHLLVRIDKVLEGEKLEDVYQRCVF